MHHLHNWFARLALYMSNNLRIIFFGDVVGRPGRKGLAKMIPEIKKNFPADLVIANVENSAHGKGVTESTLKEIEAAGVLVFTSGEHIYDKAKDAAPDEMFVKFPTLLKPANFSTDKPGRGELVIDTDHGKVLVISLIGQVFFRYQNLSPWVYLPEIINKYQDEKLAAVVLDFHAEATSEKLALARHFDGEVSAVLGTHTHIPTADAHILPKGTAYVTDVGMNGPVDSVLGMKSEVSINRFLTNTKIPYEIAESNKIWLNYVMIEIDPATKKAINIKHEHQIIQINT